MRPRTSRRPPHEGLIGRLLALTTGGLLTVAFVLAIARTADPEGYRGVQLATAAPAGLPVAVVALLVAWYLSLAPGRQRPYWRAVGAAALATAVLFGWWMAPLVSGPVPKTRPGAPVTLLTQNFEYGDGASLLAEVRRTSVDVLVLVDRGEDDYPPSLVAGLRAELPYTDGVDGPAPSHTRVFSRYPLRRLEQITPGGSSRLIRVRTPLLGTIDLVAVHPAPPYQDDTAAWHADYGFLQRAVSEHIRSSSATPLVMAGDFNASTQNRPFRALACAGRLRDAVELTNSGWAPTYPTGPSPLVLGVRTPPMAQIDHVLVSAQVAVRSVRTVSILGTDHRGVLAELAPASRPSAYDGDDCG